MLHHLEKYLEDMVRFASERESAEERSEYYQGLKSGFLSTQEMLRQLKEIYSPDGDQVHNPDGDQVQQTRVGG